MTGPRTVAVTGAGGRLGSALVERSRREGADVRAWSRPEYDLDDRSAAARLVARDRPALVVHPAAWTDVDGCARDPSTARRRNAEAVGELAAACAAAGTDLVHVSTNEVFAGDRADGRGYAEDDETGPLNPYGQSKLEGERLARRAFEAAGTARLWIVRTAWLFGPPGADFPRKILAARDRTSPDVPLRVVADEVGSPTYAPDLADAILQLVQHAPAGTYHLVNDGHASRFEWARRVLERCARSLGMEAISAREFQRASVPPAWAVLDGRRAAEAGVRLRPWTDAFDAYAESLCP